MKKNKQFFITLSILTVVLAISLPSYLMAPREKAEPLVSRLPLEIGAWKGKDLPVDERSYEILETKNLILREYAKGDDKVYLYIIYSQDNRKVSHPPEVCFEGSGITIVKEKKLPLELAAKKMILANELSVEKDGITNIVLYWYKAGNYYLDNYLKQQARIALSRLQLKQTSGALIRLSAEASPLHPGRALENMKSFAKEASAYFDSILP